MNVRGKRTMQGALTGAGTGATIGANAGPYGALIGAGVGALAGGIGGYALSEDEQKQQDQLEEDERLQQENLRRIAEAYRAERRTRATAGANAMQASMQTYGPLQSLMQQKYGGGAGGVSANAMADSARSGMPTGVTPFNPAWRR